MQLAFFDIDGTLVRPSTGWAISQSLRKDGILSRRDIARGAFYRVLMRLNRLEYSQVIRSVMKVIEGRSEEEIRTWFQRAFDRYVRYNFVPSVLERVEEHRRRGDPIILLSGTSQIAGKIIAEHLPVDHLICAHAEIVDGLITSQLIEPIPYREGKIPWAQKIADETGIPLDSAFFYTDSITDRPLMERVGNPVAVNPGPLLRRLARKNGWEMLLDRSHCDVVLHSKTEKAPQKCGA
ncbi:MAG: HAD-IB family hydrolase [Myxococcales bacterium]|nr:HAD-IB family hydrolase [Myxococcales bacterium]|tara:strand:- start:506 stop:1216 length:711 start_codon:yes stop_codon:yes gene_type:complete